MERDDRLAGYVARYEALFTRSDQFRRFGLYLRGLLAPGDRKNVEAIAACLAGPDVESDLAQALQHFVSQSPWDAGRVFAAYRATLPDAPKPPAWVVHDVVFAKKGRHSVGVQRQFARSVGRKLNCQIGVAVTRVGADGVHPLALRLYLPGYWLREHRELAERTVPEADRRHLAKPDVGLQLVAELQSEGLTCRGVVAEDGYAIGGFADALAGRGLTLLGDGRAAIDPARERFDWLNRTLGLDHFEGRTWVGWHHHAALVFAAYGHLVRPRSDMKPIKILS